MSAFIDQFSTGFATRQDCDAAIETAIASATGEVCVFGPFQKTRILDPGDPDADPPVAPTLQCDGLWRFNVRSRGEMLSGQWIEPEPEFKFQDWG